MLIHHVRELFVSITATYIKDSLDHNVQHNIHTMQLIGSPCGAQLERDDTIVFIFVNRGGMDRSTLLAADGHILGADTMYCPCLSYTKSFSIQYSDALFPYDSWQKPPVPVQINR